MAEPRLTETQKKKRDELRALLGEATRRRTRDNGDAYDKAVALARELHAELKSSGQPPRHHTYMVKNRGVEPDDPNFYNHVHAIEDLLKFLFDAEANKDPIDLTIGHEFKISVFSHRWGHADEIAIKRSASGWHVVYLGIAGDCDKRGQPHLFKNLEQGWVAYPNQLEDRLEWLWQAAVDEGLAADKVQDALNELGTWISNTEKSKPRGGVWSGF